MIFLLGTQFIIDLARSTDNPARRWIENLDKYEVRTDQVRISCMSWIAIKDSFDKLKDANGNLDQRLSLLHQRIDNVLTYYRNRTLIVPIDIDIILVYDLYMKKHVTYETTGPTNPIPLEEKLVISTAIAGYRGQPVTLVDRN
jgi:hypothetical protein